MKINGVASQSYVQQPGAPMMIRDNMDANGDNRSVSPSQTTNFKEEHTQTDVEAGPGGEQQIILNDNGILHDQQSVGTPNNADGEDFIVFINQE